MKDIENYNFVLKVKDFRAIENASLIIDGITVLTGENGSGKSTISKIMYHILKTAINLDDIIYSRAENEFKSIYTSFFRILKSLQHNLSYAVYIRIRKDYFGGNFSKLSLIEKKEFLHKIIDEFTEILQNTNIKSEKIMRFFIYDFDMEENIDPKSALLRLHSQITEIYDKYKSSLDKRELSFLDEELNAIFYEDIIKDVFNVYEFGNPIVNRKSDRLESLTSLEKVIYIDTPIITGLQIQDERRPHWNDLNEMLRKRNGKTLSEIEKKKISGIGKILKKDILKGDIEIFTDDTLFWKNKEFVYKRSDKKEFDLLECATGLKSFAIVQLLLKNGLLNNSSMLIIDEPEAHLHPQWIVEYARLIVLLNKKLGVRFLISTHSPDMVSALKYIANREKANDSLHFYLAEPVANNSFMYNYSHKGTDIEDIFSSFNIALERMEFYGSIE